MMHQRTIGKSQVHLTPKWIIDALGPFDLDPCAATERPWDCALNNFTAADDGLSRPWFGFVWLNPPFDRREVGRWIERLADHGHGIALVHARTETGWFEPIWQRATLLAFLADRIRFVQPNGSVVTKLCNRSGRRIPCDSGAPIALAAFGPEAATRLRKAWIPGVYVEGWTLALRDSGSDPKGENSRSEVEGEASQSGAAKTAHRPETPSPLISDQHHD